MIDSKSIQANLSHLTGEKIREDIVQQRWRSAFSHKELWLMIQLHLFINEQQIQTSPVSFSPPFNQINKWINKNNESDWNLKKSFGKRN